MTQSCTSSRNRLVALLHLTTMRSTLLFIAGLASCALAANCTSRTVGQLGRHHGLTVQVSLNITSTNVVSNFSANPTGDDLVLYLQQAIALNGAKNVSSRYIQGNRSLTQNVSIATTFCTPSNYSGYNLSTVILATHGIGFDRNYWNGAVVRRVRRH